MAIQIFNNPEFGNVRVIDIDGTPYFVGADVAAALKYSDTFGALKKHVDDEDKLVCQIDSAGHLQCPDLVSVTTIAKDYGMSGKSFNQLLSKLAVQFFKSGMWLLYQRYARLGWTQTKTYAYVDDSGNEHCRIHTYWTQKGRLGLYDLLKHNGVLPTIERS